MLLDGFSSAVGRDLGVFFLNSSSLGCLFSYPLIVTVPTWFLPWSPGASKLLKHETHPDFRLQKLSGKLIFTESWRTQTCSACDRTTGHHRKIAKTHFLIFNLRLRPFSVTGPKHVLRSLCLSRPSFRWCEPPHRPTRASQRSGPRCSRTRTPCWPAVNYRADGGPSTKSGCGAWSRRTSSFISRSILAWEALYHSWRRRSPREPSLRAWPPTCFSRPSCHRRCSYGTDASRLMGPGRRPLQHEMRFAQINGREAFNRNFLHFYGKSTDKPHLYFEKWTVTGPKSGLTSVQTFRITQFRALMPHWTVTGAEPLGSLGSAIWTGQIVLRSSSGWRQTQVLGITTAFPKCDFSVFSNIFWYCLVTHENRTMLN